MVCCVILLITQVDKHKGRFIKRVNKSRIENLKKGHDPDSSVQQSFQRQRLLIQAFQTSTWRARVPVKRKVKLQVTVFLRFLMNILEGRRGVELLLLAQELYRCKVCKKNHPTFSA